MNHFPFYPRPGLHVETGGKAFSSSARGFAKARAICEHFGTQDCRAREHIKCCFASLTCHGKSH